MPGMTTLHEILAALQPSVREGRFVYVSSPTPLDLDAHALIVESEGVTLVLDQEIADDNDLEYDGVFGWITLDAHTSLEAIGLTAAVSTALAEAGIACNVIAGYFHDHLLVPIDQVDPALAALERLAS